MLVNNLLETAKPIPFEFLINGQFLRTSIDDLLTLNGISSETTLSVEYVRALIPPTHVTSFDHDDWVSSVDVLSSTSLVASWGPRDTHSSGDGARILSAGYDGLLRVWSTSAQLLAVSESGSTVGQPQPIKAAAFLSSTQVVSAGNDRSIRIWDYQATDTTGPNAPSGMTPCLELYGHQASVDAIAVHAPTSRILSASSDHSVGIWTLRKTDAPSAPESLLPSAFPGANKRRKIDGTPLPPTPQRGPLQLLKGHAGPTTDVTFAAADPTVGYSTSWDHTLVTWDLATGTVVSTRRTLHPLLCVTEMPDLRLLAAGSSARHLSMIDPRVDARDVAGVTLRGHTNAVVTAACEPNKPWGLISGSHDGTCRIWDLRSVRLDNVKSTGMAVGGAGQVCESVHVVRREGLANEKKNVGGDGIKVLSVKWDQELGIVSGGEDKRVQINQAASS